MKSVEKHEMPAKHQILIVGEEMGPLVEVSSQLDTATYGISITQAPRPLNYLLEHRSSLPEGVIIRLTGRENVAELHSVFSAYGDSTFVFLTSNFPPHPAVARVIGQSGSTVLSASESPTTVVATLIALIFQRKVR